MSNETTEHGLSWSPSFHTTLVVLAFLAVVSNVPIIYLFFKIKTLRYSVGNNFLVGLAVVDILCGVIMVPSALLCELAVLGEHRPRFCYFYYFVNYTLSVASVYHIVTANLAKYFAIVFPVRNMTTMTKFRLKCTIASIWIVSILAGHMPVYWPFLNHHQMIKMFHVHGIFMLVFAILIPMLIILITHAHLFFNLYIKRRSQLIGDSTMMSTDKQTRGRSTLDKKNGKFLFMFLLLFAVFVATWFPWFMIGASLTDNTNDYLLGLRFVAPILNPVVFTFMKHDFRNAMQTLFRTAKNNKRGNSRSSSSIRSTKNSFMSNTTL